MCVGFGRGSTLKMKMGGDGRYATKTVTLTCVSHQDEETEHKENNFKLGIRNSLLTRVVSKVLLTG